ncbi:MAG: LamG domain-containing protein [Myxococcota bacterium]|nr:LamG domain-containing protein [Myxococcota bacterium]
MRLALVSLLLLGCGRLGFAPVDDGAMDGATDAPPGSYAALVLAAGPHAYYRLGELTGVIASDASGNGFDGAYYTDGGTLVLGAPGAIVSDPHAAVQLTGGGGLDGTTAGVRFDPAAACWATDFTIEGWVKPERPPGGWNAGFVIWEEYLVSGFRTGWGADLIPLFWTGESGGPAVNDDVHATTPLAEAAWNHLVFTRRGSTVAIYVNGELSATGVVDYLPPPSGVVNALGSDQGVPSSAAFDEVAFYAYPLTAERVAAHHAAGRRP